MFKFSCTILISFVDFCANSFHVLTQTSCRLLLLLFGWCLCWCALVGHRGSQTHTYHNTIKLINSAIYSETDEHGEYSSCFDRQPIMPNICERMWTMNVFGFAGTHIWCVRANHTHTHSKRTRIKHPLSLVVHFPLPCTKITAARLVVKMLILLDATGENRNNNNFNNNNNNTFACRMYQRYFIATSLSLWYWVRVFSLSSFL